MQQIKTQLYKNLFQTLYRCPGVFLKENGQPCLISQIKNLGQNQVPQPCLQYKYVDTDLIKQNNQNYYEKLTKNCQFCRICQQCKTCGVHLSQQIATES